LNTQSIAKLVLPVQKSTGIEVTYGARVFY
jgi:hypothetical protein